MNKELIGIMAKFDITQLNLSKVLKVSPFTLRRKLNEGTFTQKEMVDITQYLQSYDKNLTEELIFFKK